MIKKLKYIIIAVLALPISCTQDFEEINTNTNAPADVEPEFLLRQIIYDYGEQMSYEGFVAGNLLGQYFTAVDFNLFDRHSLLESQFGGNPWPIIYKNLLNSEILLQKAIENRSTAVYEGPARVLKAYFTANLTDLYGDVPYSEALQGKSGVINPKYDSQENIYLGEEGILANLDVAIDIMSNYSDIFKLKGDILYEGNIENWIKFANSLKLKYLMRISNKVDVKQALNELYVANQYIVEASENATYSFSNSPPNNFRLATARQGDFNLYVMSLTISEILAMYNDPRVEVYFRPATNTGLFNGILNGPDASKTSITVGNYSLTGRIFREETGNLKANFLTSWEVKFLLAEAAEKGWIVADAKGLYDKGVEESFEYWNTELPQNYLTDGLAGYKNQNQDPVEQIITQKWIANITNGYEGWIEYKRTGFPKLKTIQASLNNDIIPVRMPYPPEEEALNRENYQKAASNTDGNSINAKHWWLN